MDIEFQHLLIDALDRFNGEDQSNWDVAVELAQRLGANALNVVSLGRGADEVNWLRSNMSEDWLEQYMQREFYSVDPLLQKRNQTANTTVIRAGVLGRDVSHDERDLNFGIRDANYESMFSSVYGYGGVRERKMVVFSSEFGADEHLSAGHVDKFRILGAMIASHVAPPAAEKNAKDVWDRNVALSRRERDVLLLLSEGHRNDIIAFKLGIAEVTVRKHIENTRKKMRCTTREQVLVQALLMGYL
ncbi:helix-turn-helix transcriptional regulator [Cochlodiniinecator piscidefendens]|uniref:helix-turn-helix transcriptional regulator n=1 Tax=Cochlodiniinecator piscidefendens TaxID=2715756 RepID=UPI00140944D7|nr:LuxR family transcriptional regulator [Cochlodiniinecator piscidefendens]